MFPCNLHTMIRTAHNTGVAQDLVVGDIVEVAYGNMIPADGVLVEGSEIRVRHPPV